MGAKLNELLLAEGKNEKNECLRNRALRKICAHARVVTEDGEDYISRSAIICTRNMLFGQNSGVRWEGVAARIERFYTYTIVT